MADGSVELMRVSVDQTLLGYLLNFRCGGRAMNYQSVFAEPVSAKAKPGLMTHAAAVGYYADEGLDFYSLLAGKDRYKQSLATAEEVRAGMVGAGAGISLEAREQLRRAVIAMRIDPVGDGPALHRLLNHVPASTAEIL